jgi:SAM-dependent methyltransferase
MNWSSEPLDETEALRQRYERRKGPERYSLLEPDVWQALQERHRVVLRLFKNLGWKDLSALRVLEVGCGSGKNLLELLRFGFSPSLLTGVELLADRYAVARRTLPDATRLELGDATHLELESESQDIVLASTVFSSLLDDAFQERLADVMWRWVRPGGGVLWYDFVFNNPRNPDVRGVPVTRVRTLFPKGSLRIRHVTLAPPLARLLCRIHPSLYTVANTLPLLRTHVLIWISKPA